ncbi:MAG: glycosyl hydrolase family 18 protein [Eubacteriales bacterium]|nr:glycosyl hydrolase family 18 protein [Eubacteriales bacterium]
MKKKLIPALVAVGLIVLILAVAAGTWLWQRYSYSRETADLDAYFGLETEQDVAVVRDQELTQIRGILQDGRCYLSLDAVHELLNERFYVDYNEKLLLYTLPDQVVEIGLGEPTQDGYTAAFEQDGQAWLALDYVKQYSDFNFTLYTEPNRVVLTTSWGERQVAEVKKDTALRVRGGVKSEILTQLAEGDRVTVLETLESWDKVETGDGYIGYVEIRRLTEPETIVPEKDTGYEEPDYSGNVRDHRINLAWHQVTVEGANSTFPGVLDGVTGINVISPTWYSLYDNEGTLDGIASREYVEQAHGRGLEVWALVDDFTHREDNGVDPQQVLAYTSKRRAVIDMLMSEAERCGFDGINIDFEKVTEEGGQDYIQFIRELSVRCREKGLVLSVDNYVPRNFNAHYEWAEQGVMADYVIIMGYDEHWGGSQEPGSVASLGYVTEGIEKMVQEVPAEKVINAVPLYMRIWTTAEDGSVTSRAVGTQAAYDYLAQNGVTPVWDEQTGQNYASFETGDGLVQVWLEDEQSLAAKVEVMKQHGLGGIASWKLGFDEGRKNLWGVIGDFLSDAD